MKSHTILQSLETAIPAPNPAAPAPSAPEIDNYFAYCQQMLKLQLHCQYKPVLQYLDVLCMLAKKQFPTRPFASNLFQLQQVKNRQIAYLTELVHTFDPPCMIALADLFLCCFFDMLQEHLSNYAPLQHQSYQTQLLEMTPLIENNIRIYIRELLSCFK